MGRRKIMTEKGPRKLHQNLHVVHGTTLIDFVRKDMESSTQCQIHMVVIG
jgi:hypothetical protein